MSRFLKKENPYIKESYYYTTLDCGLKIIVIPKNFPSTFAMVCCDFGGADIEYERDGKRFTLPAGTAHFLEHKMFENPDGSDAFAEFDAFGGNANAFTSYENTCYYFSCTDNFFENLNVLLRAVSGAHFTDSSVEKEKKIIEREIVMYDDMPTSNVTRNLCRALYHNHPTIHTIAGTAETISQITKETLLRAYNDFYTPENLTLCVCGSIAPDDIALYAEGFFDKKGLKRPKTIFPPEPNTVKTEKIVQTGGVATPLFSIGIKCPPPQKNDIAYYKKATAIRLAISLTFGRASNFYCENYAKGLLSERFYAGFTSSRSASHIIISGSSNDPELVLQLAIAELKHRQKVFFTPEELVREKRAAFAEGLTLFDLGEDITASMATSAMLDYDEFDCIDVMRSISFDEVKEAFLSLDLSNRSISIIQS